MTSLPDYWHPTSEADIQKVIGDGLLGETHYLDCKQEIASKADNKETGRDLASFAIDGGMLLIGVAEDKANRTFTLLPQPLRNLAEKVENIAVTIIDPPLHVIPHEIKAEADSSKGYLLVEVRPSPHAPTWWMVSTMGAAKKLAYA